LAYCRVVVPVEPGQAENPTASVAHFRPLACVVDASEDRQRTAAPLVTKDGHSDETIGSVIRRLAVVTSLPGDTTHRCGRGGGAAPAGLQQQPAGNQHDGAPGEEPQIPVD